MLLNRLQLALDDIDLAAGCRLCIFGNPLGGARRGARHLMMEAITEAIAHNGTSAAMFAVRTSSNQGKSMEIDGNQGRSHLGCPVRGTHVEHCSDALVRMHRERPAVQCMRTPASAGGGKGGAEQACREGSAGGAHLMREAINRTQSQACREGWAGGAHRLLQL